MSRAGWVQVWAIALLAAFVPAAGAATTPAELFAADASGMLKVIVSCAGGSQQGSGFLVGPRVMVTARHVMVDEQNGTGCDATAVQEGTHRKANVTRWMAIRVAASKAPTDLAVAVLDTPLTGYNFSLSPTSPKPGQLVLALGYALGQPLSFNQGHVATRPTRHDVRLLDMRLLESNGASGGPILNAKGEVVGLTQYGPAAGVMLSIDLAHMLRNDPGQLCFGVALRQQSTVCPGRKPAKVLSRDVAPKLCTATSSAKTLSYTADLPFEGCPTLVSTPTPKASHAAPLVDCWVAGTDSWASTARVYQVSDARPTLYFLQQIGQIAAGTTATLTVTAPSGALSTLVSGATLDAANTAYRYGPVPWATGGPGFIADGLWTFKATLSTGPACSYAVNLQRAS